jgi:choline dehydrogenase-like flavoprotein
MMRATIETPTVADRQIFLKKTIGVDGVSHQAGTLRFGTDPRGSVLDTNCKAHDIDNLYVADSSIFPSVGAMNPTLTIIANALRVADHIKGRLGASAPAADDRRVAPAAL